MHFLITAGGTREYIDPVRFISNASSGKMGYAIARAATKAGHNVTLISTSDLQPPVGSDFVGVDSAAEMLAAVKKFFAKCDCLIMAAAIADYTPVKPAKTKIKKAKKVLTLKLKPTVDILDWARKHKKKRQTIVGFALEDKNIRRNAEKKLKEKKLDMIIANAPSAIGADDNEVDIKVANKNWLKIKRHSKSVVAGMIIRIIEDIRKPTATC